MNFIPGCRYSARPGFLDEVVQRFIDLREKALDSHHLTTSVSCKQPDGQITSTSPDLCLSIPSRKNIPLSPSGQISGFNLRVSPDERGVAQRHQRAVGRGGRGACEDERKAVADGEVVWSWRPGAGAKFHEKQASQE
jgi:hypothetical protein